MSKIGDVIVKLFLDSDQYESGLRKSKKSTSNFSQSISKGFTMAAGKIAAIIGAVKAVGAAFEKVANSNQMLGDRWQALLSGMKGSWDELFRSIATADFSGLIGRLKDASDVARDLYNALDAMGEISTAYNIESAQQKKHMAELRIAMDDQTKSDKDRIAAAEEWLEINKKLHELPLRGLKRLEDATITKVMTQMKAIDFSKSNEEGIKKSKELFVEFFKWIASEEGEAVYGSLAKVNTVDLPFVKNALLQAGAAGQYGEDAKWFIDWAVKYGQNVNDEDREALEKSITDFLNADAEYAESSRRVYNKLNTLKNRQKESTENEGNSTTLATEIVDDSVAKLYALQAEFTALEKLDIPNALKGMANTENMPDIISDEWLERQRAQGEKMTLWLEDLRYKCEDVAWGLSNAVQQGVVNAIDELANAVASGENVDGGAMVRALLSPLADACISAGMLIMTTGTAVEALKDTLIAGLATGGWAAIAAGAGLVAVGAAAKIGLAAIGSGRGSASGHTTSAATSGAAGNAQTQNINSELTIYVKGSISGSDILLSGQRTLNSRRR